MRAGLCRALVVAVGSLVFLLALAPGADAHAFLLFSDPAFDGALSEAPETVNLVFSEAVDPRSAAVTVTDSRGRGIAVDPAMGAQGGTTLSTAILEELDTGIYQVTWEVTGVDGHGAAGEFRFAVGTVLATSTASPTATNADWGAAARRLLLLGGFAIAIGGLVGERLTEASRRQHPGLSRIARGLSWVLPPAWYQCWFRGCYWRATSAASRVC